MLLYENLAQEFAVLIGDGRMLPGDRLPSVRRLAQQRKLSISTVVQALHTLESRGVIEARPQSGYYVRGARARTLEASGIAAATAPLDVGINSRLMGVLKANQIPGMAPFGSASPARDPLMAARLSRLYARIARSHPGLLTGSDSELNEPTFVRAIVRRSLNWGYPIAPQELVVTNSCTEAIMLCLHAVTRPGDTVAVESPTYFVMLQALESLGLKALEIPTHPKTGISLEALELATRNGHVAACLLIPNGANPLGSVIPDATKQAIADLLAARDVPLIEDDVFGDLCFTSERPRPIHAFDQSGNTMLCASFSKSVSPTLRLGFVAAGRRSAQVALQKTLMSGMTNALTQRVAGELIETRGFDGHLRALRRRFGDQIARTRDAVARYFPAETRVTDPVGGFLLWLELPRDIDTTALHRKAIAAGVAFVPGEMFSVSGGYRNFLRLACGHPWSERHEQALQTLGKLMTGSGAKLV